MSSNDTRSRNGHVPERNPRYSFRRSLRILAESYAIKGMCIENQGPKGTSRFKIAERESEMVSERRNESA